MRITAREKLDDSSVVNPNIVRIGKDVIEILTSGMYVSPATIYREYVQNSVDAIDEARARGLLPGKQRGKVAITFDHAERSATIRDNGAGIKCDEASSTLLAVGGSAKRETHLRGFRGVGRLSGLAYCRELEFRTKAAGESESTSILWNCQLLRNYLSDRAFSGDLKQIIANVVSIRHEKSERVDDHFFEVRLAGIARLRNDILLNERAVSHFLSQVSPVPFAPEFTFSDAIEEETKQRLSTTPIDLAVAGETILRPHGDEVTFPGTGHKLRVTDIEFLNFANVDGETGAFGWVAHHEYVRSIPPTLGIRGLRARCGNLQVGDATLFDEFFKEARFNGWCIGEIHMMDKRIVPNARRDNFELNHHYYNFLAQLGPVTLNISKRCRSASVARTATQIVKNAIGDVRTKLKERKRIDRVALSQLKASILRARSKASRIGDENIKKTLLLQLDKLDTALRKRTPKRGPSILAYDEVVKIVSKVVTNREQAKKLIETLRRLSQ